MGERSPVLQMLAAVMADAIPTLGFNSGSGTPRFPSDPDERAQR